MSKCSADLFTAGGDGTDHGLRNAAGLDRQPDCVNIIMFHLASKLVKGEATFLDNIHVGCYNKITYFQFKYCTVFILI